MCKEEKENVHHFQKRTRNVRKSKKIKIWRRKGKFGFPCHANQFGIRGKKYLRRPCGHYHLNHQCFSLKGDLQDREGKQGDQEHT